MIIRGEPRIHPGRPIGMSASRQLLPATSRPSGLRAAPGLLAAGAALGACALLAGVTKLTRDEMRGLGYPDSMPEIDVCTSGQ